MPARILTIPHRLIHDLPADEAAELKRCEGTVMRVQEIDQYGYVWFGTDDQGHWYCLKPEEIEIVRG
jgi:hypothetical protein